MVFSWCVIDVYMAVGAHYAGMHNYAKPIQCHVVVRGGRKSIRAWEGATILSSVTFNYIIECCNLY